MIYLDNCATTKPYKEVLDTFVEVNNSYFGNAASINKFGKTTNKLLSAARGQVASILQVAKDSIFFTSCATESNNIALLGSVEHKKDFGNRIIVSKIEHPSVLETFRELERRGFILDYLNVDEDGVVDLNHLKSLLTKETILLSVMQVNNVFGTIQPIEEISEILKDYPKVHFHVDGVQGVLKDKLDLFFKNSCINEGKKVGFFGKLKKSKQEEAEEDKAIVEDRTEDADVVRKLTEDELKAMNTAEEVFNDHPLEKENLDNNENLDGFMKSVFANEQSTENVDLKNLESQNSLNMEKTKLTDLSLLREEKLDSTNSAKNGINNSNEEFFEEEVVEDTKKDKGKKKKKKMKMWKKILITIITVLIICKALFLGAVYYGGKNYPINYIEEIQKYSNEYGVDPKVVLAIMRVESNFKSDAVSKVNAKGLMQVLPDTAKHVAKLLNVNVNSVDLNDPETNVKFGTYYLKYLMQNFSNMDTVYAAYNGGIGNVNTWLKDSKYSNDGVSLYNIPSAETKNYVNKVNKALKAYEILYGKEFPTKKTKGFAKFIDNVKNAVRYIFRNF